MKSLYNLCGFLFYFNGLQSCFYFFGDFWVDLLGLDVFKVFQEVVGVIFIGCLVVCYLGQDFIGGLVVLGVVFDVIYGWVGFFGEIVGYDCEYFRFYLGVWFWFWIIFYNCVFVLFGFVVWNFEVQQCYVVFVEDCSWSLVVVELVFVVFIGMCKRVVEVCGRIWIDQFKFGFIKVVSVEQVVSGNVVVLVGWVGKEIIFVVVFGVFEKVWMCYCGFYGVDVMFFGNFGWNLEVFDVVFIEDFVVDDQRVVGYSFVEWFMYCVDLEFGCYVWFVFFVYGGEGWYCVVGYQFYVIVVVVFKNDFVDVCNCIS